MTLSATTPGRDSPGAHVTSRSSRVPVEIPTLLLILATYGGWMSVTFAYTRWPLAIVAPIAAVLITLHSSLQHEIVHGHPTRWPWLNRLFAIVPLSLWLPYDRYLHTHRAHHVNPRLTDPLDDPESYYWRPEDLARLSAVSRLFHEIQQTLAGRIVLGSFWRIGMFLRDEVQTLLHTETRT